MRHYLLVSLFFIAVLFGASCTNIDELSNDNSIARLEILDHSPNLIEIGNVTEMEGNVIYIPIIKGQSQFPLRFYASLKIDASINTIIGIDFSQEQCLASVDDEIKFHVMAKSGLTQTYFIRAKVLDPNDDNYIASVLTALTVAPEDIMVSKNGRKSTVGDTLKIYSIAGAYPITVTPTFDIEPSFTANGGLYRNFTNGETAFRFDDQRTVHKLKVVSPNGAERLWNIKLVNTPLISGSDPSISEERREGTDIEPRTFKASLIQTGLNIDEFIVDNSQDDITLILKDVENKGRAGTAKFPLTVKLDFATNAGVELFGITNSTEVIFDSYTDVKDFYMLDSQNEVSRKWKISLKEWKASISDVISFSYDYTPAWVCYQRDFWVWKWKYANAITLNTNKVDIFPDKGEIHLNMTDVKNVDVLPVLNPDNWKLELKDVKYTLSKGASTTLPNLVWTGNGSWGTPKTFTVTAEDGSVKEWKIIIKDTRTFKESDACELKTLGIGKLIPNYAKIDELGTEINETEGVVTIKMLEDIGCYPLSIFPVFNVSDYAKVNIINDKEFFYFEDENAVSEFTVTAENNIAKKKWTVKLVPAPKEVAANITTFNVNKADPNSFQFGAVTSDNDKGIVYLNLNNIGVCPMTLDYTMTVSKKSAANIPLMGKMTFSKLTEKKEVIVTAQNGTTRTWTIQMYYVPTIANLNLDIWSNSETPGGRWSTANNIVVGTRSEDVAGRGKVAVLESTVMFNNQAAGSIFLGKFNFDVGTGLKDPITLTRFGIPFQSTAKIEGIYADLWYSAGSGNWDYGSAVIELVDYNDKQTDPGLSNYEYHGFYPNGEGPRTSKNNAKAVASGEYFLANSSGVTHRGTQAAVVPRGEWQTVFIPLNSKTAEAIPECTHIHIVFSSSGRGAEFNATTGSKLKVDNIRLKYEE